MENSYLMKLHNWIVEFEAYSEFDGTENNFYMTLREDPTNTDARIVVGALEGTEDWVVERWTDATTEVNLETFNDPTDIERCCCTARNRTGQRPGSQFRVANEGIIVGTEFSDDAAVVRLSEDQAIVATVDFFTPIVDDAYTFGAIAAANAFSDLYAMGATP